MKAQILLLRPSTPQQPALERLSKQLAEVRECQAALKEAERRLLVEIARQRAQSLRGVALA